MKKAFLTGFLGIAFSFAMVACGGNSTEEDTTANAAPVEQTEEHECMNHCQMTCPDSACLANNCENCTCPEDSPCHKKEACKGDGCCQNHEACKGEGNCQKHEACKGEGKGECCKNKANGECKKAAENK